MTTLNHEILNLLSSFLKETQNSDDKHFKSRKEAVVDTNDTNRRIIIDTVRSFISNSALTQVTNVENHWEDGTSDDVYLSAYGGRIKFFNFVLTPLPYPLRIFERARLLAPVVTSLVDEFGGMLDELDEVFSPTALVDPFVKSLLDISKEVYGKNGRNYNEDIRVHISRVDYLLHSEDIAGKCSPSSETNEQMHCRFCLYNYCVCENRAGVTHASGCGPLFEGVSIESTPKLVEINNIAASLSYPSWKLFKTHRRMMKHHIVDRLNFNLSKRESLISEMEKKHIDNNPHRSYITTLEMAHNLYLSRYPPVFGSHKVCMLLAAPEKMIYYFDTYASSEGLYERCGLFVNALSVRQLCNLMRESRLVLVNEWEYGDDSVILSSVSTHYTSKRPGRLILARQALYSGVVLKDFTDCYEVSVLYYRTCYDPSFMDDPDAWSLRLLCEYSDTVKIPSIPAQLASSKRGQMVWSNPRHVDRLLASYEKRIKGVKCNKETVSALKDSYTLQVDPSLDSNADIVRDAIQNPHNYVLKSQREGGLGVLYDGDISNTLSRGLKNEVDISQYVLMKRITPPTQPSLFVVNLHDGTFEVKFHNSITELGIYCFAIYDGNVCKLNDTDGYLARTKPEFVSGSGVCAGFGFLSSLLLF